MAQTIYDTSPTHSFQVYNNNAELSSRVADKMKTASKLSQANYSMSQGRSAPKRRLSRLELLRNDYNKKLQMEREEKINKLRVIQQENSITQQNSNGGGGVVREFFAERRALEASRRGQKNPDLLPSIESHFKQVKEKKHDMQLHRKISGQPPQTNLPVGRRISLKQESQAMQQEVPLKHSIKTQSRQAGVLVRKRTKGVDKQDPLPPVTKGGSEVIKRKLVTPNKRYETHSVLIQDGGEDFEYLSPFLPVPPIQQKPVTKRSKAPLPTQSGEESASDYDDTLSNLTDHSSIPPNLSKLKAKALRQRQLSKQKLNVSTNQEKDSGKLTDFQKWQMEQDEERERRIEKHRWKTGKSEVSLSQREKDLLQKIQEEQSKLESLKNQRREMEKQERKQKEEDEEWLREKQNLEKSLNMQPQEIAQELRKGKKKSIKKVEKLQAKKTPKVEALPTQTHEDLGKNIHNNAQCSFYAEMTEGMGEVVVDVEPCSICGRKFLPDRLAKHEKVCAKTANSKRKVFDTSKQRSQGTDYEKYVLSGKHLEEPEKKPKTDWRKQHENFIKAIRYAKGISDEPPPPTENPDYVQCPHCKRKFNQAAADRHIPRCKDIKAKPSRLKKKRL